MSYPLIVISICSLVFVVTFILMIVGDRKASKQSYQEVATDLATFAAQSSLWATYRIDSETDAAVLYNLRPYRRHACSPEYRYPEVEHLSMAALPAEYTGLLQHSSTGDHDA